MQDLGELLLKNLCSFQLFTSGYHGDGKLVVMATPLLTRRCNRGQIVNEDRKRRSAREHQRQEAQAVLAKVRAEVTETLQKWSPREHPVTLCCHPAPIEGPIYDGTEAPRPLILPLVQ